jgi:hypothetical protein
MRTRNQSALRRKASNLDEDLDAALRATFPASDPVSIGQPTATEPPVRPTDRRAPAIDLDTVLRLAKTLAGRK